ncbi:hypothetical protein AVEN_240012-1 [Araneus ventricosus]|uniref:Endonuclease/exonuclease/phosphatase domain-containing protein n=1 Tax=Araneus ventricosus TaxID=182803 RepID=A0A4Y2SH50_ARAVE|nr:hypothetical protein AVEN_240012-1 [Araneus ventricosus]
MFSFNALIAYSETSLLIDEEFHIDKDAPIIVMGDFNADVRRSEKAFGFMKKHFDLDMVPTNYPSTLGNSYIDSCFTRNISPELLNYIEDIVSEISDEMENDDKENDDDDTDPIPIFIDVPGTSSISSVPRGIFFKPFIHK